MEKKHIIDTTSTLRGALNEETKDWKVYQDERPFIEQAKQDREAVKKKDLGYKKAFTIPDIVAIDILSKYGIDVHSVTFMNDRDQVRKVFQIVKEEYPYLMSY